MKIINNAHITLSPEAQEVIKNSAANYDIDNVVIAIHPNDGNNNTLFNVFNENNNILFSIDTESLETF